MKWTAALLGWWLALAAPALAITVTDSRGSHEVPASPDRVVVLSWSLAEQVIQLDETPIAIADPEGYRTWVVRPLLAEGVASVGTRREPNLERIAALKPDLILVSDDQRDLIGRLEAIAPVLHFDGFRQDHNNYLASRESYRQLGRLFGKEGLARQRLAALDQRLADLRRKVSDHFGGRPPKVTPVRFLDDARVRVHGANSMAQYALEALGLEHGFPQPPTQWGFVLKRIEDLSRVEDGFVLHIQPFAQAQKVFSTQLWAFMPFVKAGRFAAVPPTWTFGGPFSVGFLAEAFAEALLTMKP